MKRILLTTTSLVLAAGVAQADSNILRHSWCCTDRLTTVHLAAVRTAALVQQRS